MRRITSWSGSWWLLGLLLTFGLTRPARAIYLDDDQNISLRARIYSQAGIRTNDSQVDTVPTTKTGQLIQHRNFFNPELEAKLTSYTTWMKNGGLGFIAPDDFSFRIAGWGFYDGIYDYGARQFGEAGKTINSNFPDLTKRTHAFYLESADYNSKGNSVATVFPNNDPLNAHDIFATQRRVNELYLSYTKGPFFMRVGRQAISWGESDTIGILDQNNPFDLTQAAPGIFEDIDEARIPLWTIRTSLNLFDTLGPLSSGFVEAYWVPGDIDTNTGWSPAILGASPYSARGQDPQSLAGPQLQALQATQVVIRDAVPKTRFENSRYGFRLQTVLNRDYTLSAWFYTHFPSQPPPLSRGIACTDTRASSLGALGCRNQVALFTTETVHDLTNVYGGSATFFSEPLDGIIRIEGEFFNHEPGFIAKQNLGVQPGSIQSPGDITTRGIALLEACTPDPKTGKSACSVAYQDVLRWEIGYDRFFFVRPLNPSNSFLLSVAQVGGWSLTQTSNKPFGFAGQRKPGTQGLVESDYVPQKVVEAFAQAHLQTDYMHGRLSPSITYIQNVRGTYAILPSITYRWTDWLLFTLQYITIGGEYESFGFFRDRDQVSMRMTYQLN